MAQPLRFRHSPERWTPDRVHSEIERPLDDNLGASAVEPRFDGPGGWSVRRFEMDNGDLALFAWTDEEAYWMGNTETPSALWQTEKYTFDEVPYPVARWAQRELLADLRDAAPWLAEYPHVEWFFLPVFMSKDGREATRTFFREHAAGFPDADAEDALAFYESCLRTGVLDDDRYVMAAKLGTAPVVDQARMAAAMSEITVASLLDAAGHEVVPEVPVSTGHDLDFRVHGADESAIVEVTRPQPPNRRAAGTPTAAVRETVATKTGGQLAAHGGGVTLFVDCSGFPDDDWAAVRAEEPTLDHSPAVVFRVRPDGNVEAFEQGTVPVDVSSASTALPELRPRRG